MAYQPLIVIQLQILFIHTYWLYTYDFYVNNLLVTLFINELELICLYTVNDFMYYYLTTILFDMNHLSAQS